MNIKQRIISFSMAAATMASMIGVTGAVTASAATWTPEVSSASCLKTNGKITGAKFYINNKQNLNKNYSYLMVAVPYGKEIKASNCSQRIDVTSSLLTNGYAIMRTTALPSGTYRVALVAATKKTTSSYSWYLSSKSKVYRYNIDNGGYTKTVDIPNPGSPSNPGTNTDPGLPNPSNPGTTNGGTVFYYDDPGSPSNPSDPGSNGGLVSGTTTNTKSYSVESDVDLYSYDYEKRVNVVNVPNGDYKCNLYNEAGSLAESFPIKITDYCKYIRFDSGDYQALADGKYTIKINTVDTGKKLIIHKNTSTGSSGEGPSSNTNFEDAVDNFFYKYRGIGVNYPHAGGYNQCVSLTAQYIKEVIGQTLSQPGMPGSYANPDNGGWGGSNDINIIKNNFKIMTGNAITNVKKGDIIVTLQNDSNLYGHVMIAAENKVINYYNCGGTFHIYDQNGTGNDDVTTYREFWPGNQYFAAVLRPNVNL